MDEFPNEIIYYEQTRLYTVKYFSEGYIEQHIMH